MEQSKSIKVNTVLLAAGKQSAWVQLSLRPENPDLDIQTIATKLQHSALCPQIKSLGPL